MNINEIERQLSEQNSLRKAFPSQGPTFDQMFLGQNQIASLKMQIELAKLTALNDKKLENLNQTTDSLLKWTELHQKELKKRGLVEEQRYKENTRLSRIAAWSGVVSTIVTLVFSIANLLLK